jgi:hypothetical protein
MKSILLAVLACAIFSGCSGSNEPSGGSNQSSASKGTAQPAANATITETGRSAFQKTYISARGWAADAQPYSEESQPTQDALGRDGKSAVWTARFGSAARGGAKAFTWSGSDAPDAPARGVIGGAEDSFSPSNRSTRTFDLGFCKLDSDQAVTEAEKHGGKKLLDKDPKMPVYYRLHWDSGDNVLVWNVMFGGNGSDSKLNVRLDATTGSFIKIEK